MDSLPMTAVRVTGFSQATTDETLELFFESRKKCGGDEIQAMRVNQRRTVAVIDYGSTEVVERVAQRQGLELHGSKLFIAVCRPDEDENCELITRAALGRVAKIGALYDVRTDTILDHYLFDSDTGDKSVTSTHIGHRHVKNGKASHLGEMLELLDLEPDLHLSLMSGLIQLDDPTTEFIEENKDPERDVVNVLRAETVKEEFAIRLHQAMIDKNLLNSVSDKKSATHVILGITWGSEYFITPEYDTSKEDCHLKPDEEYLHNLLSRDNSSVTNEQEEDTASRSGNWTVLLAHGNFQASARVQFQGDAQHIKSHLEMNTGKGVPLAYALMPLEDVARLCNCDIKASPFVPIEEHLFRKVAESMQRFTARKDHIVNLQSTFHGYSNYISDNCLEDLDNYTETVKSDKIDFESKLRELVVKIRCKDEDASALERLLQESENTRCLDQDEEKCRGLANRTNILSDVQFFHDKGITCIGKTDQLTFDDAENVYVFFKPAEYNALVEKREQYFLRCQLSRSLQETTAFKVVYEEMRPDLWGEENKNASISVYKHGCKICDDRYIEDGRESEMDLIRRKEGTKTSQKVYERQAYVKMRCPTCFPTVDKRFPWKCAACKGVVEYGMTSKNFSCSCGMWDPSDCEFRCNEQGHGVDFFPYPSESLKDEVSLLKETKEKNILILGETGVGKSTWINGIFNYLTFDNLDEAMNADRLLSLIPASFTFTYNGKSVEVKTGEANDNEVLEIGQSATQGTRSYVFKVGDQKIRLIDTPGIGDSRGLEQDRRNFDNILIHLSKFDEIHAICVLLKPNNSRLTVVFRFCIQELLARLHTSAKQNIVFCFTNARATFYQPGDTLPALNAMLKKKNIGIEATPDNYFCFDNEPFRFLACTNNDIKFGETDVATFATSWDKVVSETKKLFEKIDSMKPHKVRNTLSMNEARRVIVAMSKPMAEVAKTIQENVQIANDVTEQMDLQEKTMDDLKKSLKFSGIDLVRKELSYPMTVCTDSSCIERVSVGSTNIKEVNYKQVCHSHCSLEGIPTETTNDERLKRCACISGGTHCRHCKHHYTQHMHLTYHLEKVTKDFISKEVQQQINNKKTEKERKAAFKESVDIKISELKEEEKTILQVSAKYGAFLQNNCIIPYNDAIGDYIDMSIDQEEKKPSDVRNGQFLHRLKDLRVEYDKERQILDESLSHGYTTTPEEVVELQQTLFQLKHFGKTLKNIFDGISISQSAKGLRHDETEAPYIRSKRTTSDPHTQPSTRKRTATEAFKGLFGWMKDFPRNLVQPRERHAQNSTTQESSGKQSRKRRKRNGKSANKSSVS